MNKNLMIVIAALLVIFGLVMSGYNNLVGMNENINGKWSQIENQLQRRNDLIPNLVNTVKGYAAHESDVFKAVADARAKLGGAKTVQEASQADGELSGALSLRPTPTLRSCRMNWQALKTALPYPARITTTPYRNSTPASNSSQPYCMQAF